MSKLYVDEIASKTGGTDALTIDSTGRILTPARPSFKAKTSSTVAFGVNTDIIFNDVTTSGFGLHNVGGHYDTSTGIFTAPINGVYFFQFQVSQQSTSDTEVLLYLGTQDVGFARNFSDGANYDSLSCCQNLMLSASNQIKARVVSGTAHCNASVASFSGFLIG